MSKEALELRKLELELQKMPFEMRKLEAEAEDLHARVQAGERAPWTERLKAYPAYLTAIVSILLAFVTFLQYQAQQERDRQFKLSIEMLKLIEQINHDEPAQQTSAALAMSLYGRRAVPILVENLVVPRKPVAQRAIVRALELVVAESPAEDVDYVVGSLSATAREFIERELIKPKPDSDLLEGIARALGSVGREARRRQALSTVRRDELADLLESALQRLQQANLSAKQLTDLAGEIERQLKRLKG